MAIKNPESGIWFHVLLCTSGVRGRCRDRCRGALNAQLNTSTGEIGSSPLHSSALGEATGKRDSREAERGGNGKTGKDRD